MCGPFTGETPAAPGRMPGADEAELTPMQATALERIERVRRLELHVAAFLLGLLVLGGPWVAVSYVNAGGWPERFSGDGGAGDWDPFVPAVLLVWALFVAIKALRLYFHRPPSQADVERAVERLQRR